MTDFIKELYRASPQKYFSGKDLESLDTEQIMKMTEENGKLSFDASSFKFDLIDYKLVPHDEEKRVSLVLLELKEDIEE